VFGLIRA